MFHAVMRSPMLFFGSSLPTLLSLHHPPEADSSSPLTQRKHNAETTPLGTILNRFSRDVLVIDETLARVFGGFARTLAGVFGMIAVIASSAPAFLLILVPVLFVYKSVQTYISPSSFLPRDVRAAADGL